MRLRRRYLLTERGPHPLTHCHPIRPPLLVAWLVAPSDVLALTHQVVNDRRRNKPQMGGRRGNAVAQLLVAPPVHDTPEQAAREMPEEI